MYFWAAARIALPVGSSIRTFGGPALSTSTLPTFSSDVLIARIFGAVVCVAYPAMHVRREMHDDAAAVERLARDRRNAQVAHHRVDVGMVRRADQVENAWLVARCEQLVDHVRADEARAARDQDPHWSSGR